MKKLTIIMIITIFCFVATLVFGSEPAGYNKIKEDSTEILPQKESETDEWANDPDWLKARQAEKTGADQIMSKPNRIQIDSGYDHLSDHYGNWENVGIKYFRKETSFTYFFEFDGFVREEGKATLLAGGLYKDWNSWFYTYTAVASGTNSDYLPLFRIDQDFNLKFGKKKNIVFTAGGTYIDYHIDHYDVIFSAGLTGYFDKWILEYRAFRNISYPGSVGSFSQTFAVTYGNEGAHWTSMIFSYGNQAYNTTDFVTSQNIDQKSMELRLRHQHWIKENWGLYGEGRFFRLINAYERYGLNLGIFYDF